MARRWYVVRVQSGRENTVQTALERKLKRRRQERVIPRVLVPMETVTEVKGGRKRTRKQKLYPGYVLVEVTGRAGKIPRDVWFLVRETAGVGDFVGPHGMPSRSPQERSRRSSPTWSGARSARPRCRSRSRRATR